MSTHPLLEVGRSLPNVAHWSRDSLVNYLGKKMERRRRKEKGRGHLGHRRAPITQGESLMDEKRKNPPLHHLCNLPWLLSQLALMASIRGGAGW